ncbi:MAG: hypothetical protein J7455_11800 [Roseiflexus sp.]|nr:hypothetical protein [Roseiflexus sp.]
MQSRETSRGAALPRPYQAALPRPYQALRCRAPTRRCGALRQGCRLT